MSETGSHSMIKPAMTYGLIIALAMIIMAVIIWIAGIDGMSWIRFANWAVQLGVLYYCLKNWRDQYQGGFISYGQALKAGIIFMFFASIIFSFYTVIYLKWLDPTAIDRMTDLMEEEYYNQGLSEAEVDLALNLFARMKSPGVQFFFGIFGGTLVGIIWSLIVSTFVKREGDPFSQAMNEVKED